MQAHVALRRYFERKKRTSPGFSLRSLAARLEISPSFLSRIFNGKKPIPAELGAKLASALDVEPELLPTAALSSQPTKPEPLKEVTSAVEDWEITETQALQVLRNWYYLPVLEFTTLKDFDGSVEQIATGLRLPLPVAEVALRELESLGLLRRVNGRYEKVHEKIRFTSAKTIPWIRKFHDNMMERAQAELRNATSEEEYQKRLITGITLTADPEKIQVARQRLAECLHEIANDLIASPGTEVYHLAVQLFPLTRRGT
ncbi:MAG: TIGR02147 family protein [Bdellovibrionales bacterium]